VVADGDALDHGGGGRGDGETVIGGGIKEAREEGAIGAEEDVAKGF
jgi:hypothetical protein